MPSLDLTRTLSLSHAGQPVASLGYLGRTIWTRPSGAPEIAILTGSGYLGSTYVSTVADQWYADDDAILGATGSTWTMDLANEGKAIRCGDSNMIEMWVPDDLTKASTTDVWTADGQVTANGNVTKWVNRISSRATSLQQTTASSQPTAGTINGMPCAVWPDTQNRVGLDGSVSRDSSYAMVVIQYMDGTSSAFVANAYAGMLTSGIASMPEGRILIGPTGLPLSNNFVWSTNTWEMRKNASVSSTYIPLPLSVVEFSGQKTTGNPSLGYDSRSVSPRGWSGPICLYALAETEPSAADRAKLQGYAAHRYGIAASLPSDHPYKSAAPRIQ